MTMTQVRAENEVVIPHFK